MKNSFYRFNQFNIFILSFLLIVMLICAAHAQGPPQPILDHNDIIISVNNIAINGEITVRGLTAYFPWPILSTISVVDSVGNIIPGLADTSRWLKPDEIAENGMLISDIWKPLLEYHEEDTLTPPDPDLYHQKPEPLITEIRTIAPLSVCTMLVMDVSQSMIEEIEEAKAGVRSYVRLFRPNDRGGIIQFESRIVDFLPMTNDTSALIDKINSATPSGGTAIYDALIQAIEMIKCERGRRSIIIYTDGDDRSSLKATAQSVIDSARANNLPIHTIALGIEIEHEEILKMIADQTNGLFFKAVTVEEMKDIYGKLSIIMHNYYVMAHASPDPEYNRTWRSVDVTANLPGISGRAVGRYYVPGPQPQSFTDLAVSLESKTDTTIDVEGKLISAAKPGEVFDYIIRFKNEGPDRAEAVRLTHFLPDSVNYRSASIPPQTSAANSLGWTFPAIMPGVDDSIIVTVQLSDEVPRNLEQIISRAEISAPDDTLLENNVASDTAHVLFPEQLTDLRLTLNSITSTKAFVNGDSINAVLPGETFKYQIDIANLGMNPADTVTILQRLPDYVNYVSSIPDLPTKTDNSFNWKFLNWQPLESKSILVTVQLEELIPPAWEMVFSEASLSSSSDTNPSNNSASDTIKIIFEEPPPPKNFDLSVEQFVNSDTTIIVSNENYPAVFAGESYRYTLIIANLGPDASPEFDAWDVIPDSVTFANFDIPFSKQNSDTVFWRFDSLPAGDTLKIGFDALVARDLPFAPFPIINETGVVALNDTTHQNNIDTTIVYAIIKSQPSRFATDLELRMFSITDSTISINQDTSNVVIPGENYEYFISIRNKGPFQADSVKLVHSLPDSVSFISSTVAPQSQVNGATIWEFDIIEPFQTVDILLNAKLSEQTPQSLTQLFSQAEIFAQNDSTKDNNIVEDIVLVRFRETPPPTQHLNLAIRQIAISDTAIVVTGKSVAAIMRGGKYTYKIIVENFGPSDAKDFSVWDVPPDSVAIVGNSLIPTKIVGDTLFWQIDQLNVGESLTIDLDAKVVDDLPFTPFPLLNRAGLVAEQDTLADDNFSERVVYAIARPDDPRTMNADISVRQYFQTDSSVVTNNERIYYVKAGEQYIYEIEISNESRVAAENVILTDFIPDSVSTSSYNPKPNLESSDSTQWNLGYMLPQTKTSFRLNVTVASKMPVGKNLLIHQVKASASNEDPAGLANNTASKAIINLVRPAGGWQPFIEASPSRVKVGSNIKVRVQVTVPVESWDLFVYLADGTIDREYGDPFIAATDLVPNQWIEIDPQYAATRMYSSEDKEPLIFEFQVIDVFGELKTAEAIVEIESEDDFIMDRNLFIPDQENELPIKFKISSDRQVRLEIYDITGTRISRLTDSQFSAGWNTYRWDGLTETGQKIGSGFYILTIHSGEYNAWKKIIIVR